MQSKLILIVIVLLVLGGGYYFISRSTPTTPVQPVRDTGPVMEDTSESEDTDAMDEEDAVPGDEAMENKPTDEEAMMDKGGVKTFEIGGGAFYFDPAELTVTEGDTVKIVFTDEGGVHDFVLDEFDVKTTTLEETGATTEVEFVANQAGTFEYYCSVGTHREQGMVGTLVVEPKQ